MIKRKDGYCKGKAYGYGGCLNLNTYRGSYNVEVYNSYGRCLARWRVNLRSGEFKKRFVYD